MGKFLNLIPLFMMTSIVLIPFVCFFMYKKRKVRTCLVLTHIWCLFAAFIFGMFLLHSLRRNLTERPEYSSKAMNLLQINKNLREGEIKESIKLLDASMSATLWRSAYDISDEKMGELDPQILYVWQEYKDYYETYNLREVDWGNIPNNMVALVHRKLDHVPWSKMQMAIQKFEQTYKSGQLAPAPAINMKSWITEEVPNEELKGKVVLLDFWNVYCTPCVKSFPELQKLHDKYKEQGLVVITCAGGNKKQTRKLLEKHGYSFPAGMVTSKMYSDYAIRANPSYFLIDRNGYLVWGPEHRLPTEDELADLLMTNEKG